MSPFSAIDYQSLTHWSRELSRTGSLHLSDGVSEWINLPSIPIIHSLRFAYSRVKNKVIHLRSCSQSPFSKNLGSIKYSFYKWFTSVAIQRFETIATLVNYKCKSFIKLTPRWKLNWTTSMRPEHCVTRNYCGNLNWIWTNLCKHYKCTFLMSSLSFIAILTRLVKLFRLLSQNLELILFTVW